MPLPRGQFMNVQVIGARQGGATQRRCGAAGVQEEEREEAGGAAGGGAVQVELCRWSCVGVQAQKEWTSAQPPGPSREGGSWGQRKTPLQLAP